MCGSSRFCRSGSIGDGNALDVDENVPGCPMSLWWPLFRIVATRAAEGVEHHGTVPLDVAQVGDREYDSEVVLHAVEVRRKVLPPSASKRTGGGVRSTTPSACSPRGRWPRCLPASPWPRSSPSSRLSQPTLGCILRFDFRRDLRLDLERKPETKGQRTSRVDREQLPEVGIEVPHRGTRGPPRRTRCRAADGCPGTSGN